MIAQIVTFNVYDKYNEGELKGLLHDVVNEYVSKHKGFINGYILKKKDNVWQQVYFFDNQENALDCIMNYTSWHRAKDFKNFVEVGKVAFYHYDVIETIGVPKDN